MQKGQDYEHELMKKVRKYLESQRYRLTEHAIDRLKQRFLELRDIVYILHHGYHEEEKTLFNSKMQCWNYAIRGKTTDKTEARVIIAFEKDMIIITALRLTKGQK